MTRPRLHRLRILRAAVVVLAELTRLYLRNCAGVVRAAWGRL